MRAFIQRYLDPADRLGEIMFGLIMAIGFTGAVRLGGEDTDSRSLFVAILGCNVAWGVVDGVMFALLELFERGRKARIVAGVLSARTEDAALEHIGSELDDRLESLTTPEERQHIYRAVLSLARRASPEQPRLCRQDLLGGVSVGLVVVLATLPIVVPFVFIANLEIAVRLSNTIALAMLFAIGCWWGRMVGTSPVRVGASVTLVGLILVAITIALGG